MSWGGSRAGQMKKTPEKRIWGLRFSGEKIKVSVVLSYRLIELLTYRVNCVSHSATRSIRLWLCRWCSAKRRCLFSFFASTTFQERHCAPASLRMYQNGTQGRLSFQGCKPPCCTCRTGGWYALSRTRTRSKLPSYREPLSLL